MRWITRENVKVDRVACPWLIKRFVDADAEFLFVPDRNSSPPRNERVQRRSTQHASQKSASTTAVTGARSKLFSKTST
jgi:hypothetical protein